MGCVWQKKAGEGDKLIKVAVKVTVKEKNIPKELFETRNYL